MFKERRRDMNCVVCEKPKFLCEKPITRCFTCSPICAGKLAQSSKEVNILREQFNTPEKAKIRKYLYGLLTKVECEKPKAGLNILDFWGGGLFSDYVLDQHDTVKNHVDDVNLYELDSNKDLWPALRKYALLKNHCSHVKNHGYYVTPFCGSLAEFVQQTRVKNHQQLDLIWLDYCKTYKDLREDMQYVKQISSPKTVLAVTVSYWGDETIDRKHRTKNIESVINDYLPLHRQIKHESYGIMEFYVFKAKSKLLKQAWTTQLYG